MAKMADINEPYKRCPHAEKWDSLTVEEFINQNAWTKGIYLIVGKIKANIKNGYILKL
jgi:hypothetical protein